ncbi:hypothetical protein MLD38_029134 [Melastoma candidum]|uniref:Uncharacterized protein n=2 Tax=Melastoma candidum TaxID=119954 RepID=A0ACB9N364_9MYRT|nr:hypothetical protein MLD38_029134 [Melastoma candidum]
MPAARDDVSEEKVVVNLPLGPPVDDLKASVVVERKTKSLIPFTVFRFRLWCSFTYKNVCSSEELDVTEPAEEKRPRVVFMWIGSDMALARVEMEKRMCLIKAWEDRESGEQTMSAIVAWQNSKKGDLEAERTTIEEKLKKQKAEYIERMKSKLALI